MSSSHEVDGETPQLQTRPQSALERDQGERGEELDRAVCREIGQQGTPGARVVTSPSTTASMAWLRNMQQADCGILIALMIYCQALSFIAVV